MKIRTALVSFALVSSAFLAAPAVADPEPPPPCPAEGCEPPPPGVCQNDPAEVLQWRSLADVRGERLVRKNARIAALRHRVERLEARLGG